MSVVPLGNIPVPAGAGALSSLDVSGPMKFHGSIILPDVLDVVEEVVAVTGISVTFWPFIVAVWVLLVGKLKPCTIPSGAGALVQPSTNGPMKFHGTVCVPDALDELVAAGKDVTVSAGLGAFACVEISLRSLS